MRTLLVISILVWSFHLSEASCVTRYRGIANDYEKWKNEPNSPEDPVPNYTARRQKELCARFWYANKYTYSESDSNISTIPDDQILYQNLSFIKEVHDYKITVESPVKTTMYTILCASGNDRNYYLTFAFREHHYVILSVPEHTSEVSSTTDVQFYALIQPDGKVDDNLTSRPQYFAHSFWGHSLFEGFNEKSVVLPSKMDLCSITEYQHFGLCSAVANKVRTQLSENYGIDMGIQMFNTIPKISERCVTKSIADEERKLKTSCKVLPCFINKETPQFYLLRSPLDEPIPSVFVLVRTKSNDNSTDVLELATKVDHVYNIL